MEWQHDEERLLGQVLADLPAVNELIKFNAKGEANASPFAIGRVKKWWSLTPAGTTGGDTR